MSKTTNFEAGRRARRISEQAVAWYLEQQDHPSERQRAAFLAWLHVSPAHVAEYLAIAQMHGDLKAAASMETMAAADLVEQARRENPVVVFPLVVADMARESLASPQYRHPWRRTLAQAVACAAIVALVLLAGWQWRMTAGNLRESYAADADSIRDVRLPDGSLIQLARNSQIQVRFDARYRQVEVIRGNALFAVGKDPSRPMLVRVDGHILQDIGTVFDVKRDADSDSLTVISGRVRVWNAPREGAGEIKIDVPQVQRSGDKIADLTAGEQIQLSSSGIGTIRPGQVEQATAWLPRDIRFQHETISDVAQRFNAYTSTPLVIEDARIADMQISGVFHANDPQAFSAYLATLPGVRVVHDSDRVRVIASSGAGDTKAGSL
ncbi:FecR domain-containing protein [Rhodanobacter sp. MP7CTX1]|uniref:FecR family protein n=1 Tax=Rhodanobacter sp. MP7CTX1 TaxID=2723084 RepID=UPI001613AAA5|nr:FecR domain-containing protein [Rhodanobacter sp. MP7CTX1]MBB6187970.1 transmembrane sensor [Rhodanobacter sp. MP7CTX1]